MMMKWLQSFLITSKSVRRLHKQQMLHSFGEIFKQLEKFAEEEFVEQLFYDQLFAPPSVIKARDVKSPIV